MGYSKRTSNYQKRIALCDPTHMMSIVDHVAIGVETPRITRECYLDKEFTELICVNPRMVLCQTVNQVYSCHCYVCGPLT